MKSKHLLLMLFLALLAPWVAKAQETFTLYGEETGTNSYVPVYGTWADAGDLTCEFIIPASELTEMDGATITKMVFYLSSQANVAWDAPYEVYLSETPNTTLTALVGNTGATKVFSGTLNGNAPTMEVLFNEAEYEYGGGNLLVGFYETGAATYNGASFYGKTFTTDGYNAYYGYTSSWSGFSSGGQKFIPRITFTYEPGGACPKPTNVHTTLVAGHQATLEWTGNAEAAKYMWKYKVATATDWSSEDAVTEPTVTLTGLDPETEYNFAVASLCNSGVSEYKEYTFITGVACTAPVNLAVDPTNINAYGATATWTGASNSYVVMIGETETSINTIDFEDQTFPANFTNDATRPWTVAAGGANGSGYCIIPGNSGVNSSSSNLTLEVAGPCTISFWAAVSSESGWDKGYFLIDGVEQFNISGTQDWTEYTYDLTEGTHTLTWRYYKDGSGASGSDLFYVDNITFPSVSVPSWTEYTAPSATYTFDNLTPSTNYQVKVKGNCGAEGFSAETAPVSFSTIASCMPPDAVTVDANSITAHNASITWTPNGTPDSYVVMVGEVVSIVSETFEDGQIPASFTTTTGYEWTAVANTHSGAYCARSIQGANSQTSAMSVEVNLSTDATLTFSAKVSSESNYDKAYFYIDNAAQAGINGISGAGDWIDYTYQLTAGAHTLRWAYTKDNSVAANDDCFYVDDIKIDGVSTWDDSRTAPGTATGYDFTGLNGGTTYYVKVKGICGSDESDESTPVNFTTEVSCQVPTDLTYSELDAFSVKLSWTDNANVSEWEICKNGDESNLINATTNTEFLLDGLIDNTPYTVKVRANCGGEGFSDWSDPVSFTTPIACDVPTNVAVGNITVSSADVSWDGTASSYNVHYRTARVIDGVEDDYENGMGNWTLLTLADGNGWVQINPSAFNDPTITSHSGDYVAMSRSYDGNTQVDITADNWMISPVLTIPSSMSFWYKGDAAYPETFYVCVSTAGTATTDFAVVATYTENPDDWTQEIIDLSAYAGQQGYIAFHNSYYGGDYLFIDDVAAFTEVAPAGAWTTANGVTSPYTMPSLDPKTVYTVEVQANCGAIYGESEWVPAQFETLPTCTVPEGLAVDGTPGAHSATLTWTAENETKYEYCLVENAPGYVPTDGEYTMTTDNFVEYASGLAPQTPYTFFLRKVCGGTDHSDAVSVNFTTDIACYPPTSLEVTANSVTSDGAIITWTAGANETEWRIEYADNASFTNPMYETVNDNPTYTFQGLDESTTYYVHVQAVCGGIDGSSYYSNTVNFTTTQNPANLPYDNDFETENGWLFVNGTITNAWAYGEATNNGGTHALYISNDGGTTNAYTNNSSTMVYATKLFNFEGGVYTFSYDWRANGESTWDYLRVALVPSTVQLTASTSAPSGFGTSTLPTGWIALDGGGKLNQETAWQSFASDEIEVAAGNYMMVFAWRNDNSSGSNSPAAIDNVSIEKIACTTPNNLAAPQSGITAKTAKLSWHETGEATAWQIELTDANSNTTTIDVTVSDLDEGAYKVTGLTSEMQYTFRVRANCGGSYSGWSAYVNFETAQECQVSDGLAAANITTSSANISWNGYGQTKFNLRYSTDGVTWTTETEVTANPYPLSGLTEATTYYVEVQPMCAATDAWSAQYSFTTLCDAKTITATNSFTEGFENWTTDNYDHNATNGVYPTCWDSKSEGSIIPHIINSGSYAYIHDGDYTMYFMGQANKKAYLALPVFTNNLNTLIVTFWMKTENASYGTLSLGYITDADVNYNTFTVIKEYDNSTSMVQRSAVLSNIPSNATRLVFRWYYTGTSWYGACIDDVEVLLATSYTKAIEANNWYAIASPVKNPNVTDVQNLTTGAYDLYRYNEANSTWQNYKAGSFTTLETGRGYIYRRSTPETLVFTGVTNTENEFDNLTYSASNTELNGFNLVGNPYGTGYATVDLDCYKLKTNGTWVPQTSYQAEAMEGVLVHATAALHSVIFTPVTNSKSTPAATPAQTLAFTVNGNGYEDVTYAMLEEGDNLPKISHFAADAPMLSIAANGSSYAIARLGYNVEAFDMSFSGNGSYTLTAELGTLPYCHLIDRVAGKDIDLLSAKSYTFSASSNDANRFVVVLTPNGEEDILGNFVYWNGNGWTVDGNGTLEVYDVLGRPLFSKEVADQSTLSTQQFPAAGVYMLRMGDKSQKIVVK